MKGSIVLVNDTDDPEIVRSATEERHHRLTQLIAALRLFSRWGYDEGEGFAGHFACRDPEVTNAFWVNPVGVHLSTIDVDDLVLLDYEGNVLAGRHPVNIGALVLHSSVLAARPDVVASAHFHSTYGRVWAATGRILPIISQDTCAFYQDQAVDHEFGGLPHTFEDGRATAEALGEFNTLILKYHGLLTVGASVEAAAWRYITLERACQAQVLSAGLGPLEPIPHEVALRTRKYVASEESARAQFQPLYDYIEHLDGAWTTDASRMPAPKELAPTAG
ncbi:class II aldolase/adducin family protein [Streptomyces badius]